MKKYILTPLFGNITKIYDARRLLPENAPPVGGKGISGVTLIVLMSPTNRGSDFLLPICLCSVEVLYA